MFCLLPPTRLALGDLHKTLVADASGLFNLMRNLGGAIGIALIDTVIYSRSPTHAADLTRRLLAGDTETAAWIGLSPDIALDAAAQAKIALLIESAALTQAINDAWGMIAALTIAALFCVPFAKKWSVQSARPIG